MKKEQIVLRKAEESDIDDFINLIMRMKRLNGEFDSIFKANDENIGQIKEYYLSCIKDKEKFVTIVAIAGEKMAGLVKAEVRNRISYYPPLELRIVDLYIMPEFRRKKVGNLLINAIYDEMKKRKITIVTAEFPSLNMIALNFYKKIGYREITSVYGKVMEENKE
ncbi:GNAT family N-acetyltransferase [Cuniculiplasma sp. SKW3]|uniref:GNAT family N-acetyltransferase n=1 Tax=Cuniculiplasma sp. SKW3 TaxID=3400170 RepID=UPI003FD62328